MRLALDLALEAQFEGEVPVGCVVVDASGEVIGSGRNRREKLRTATAHAELEAIDNACRTIGDHRLQDCTLYVTLEPCPMCAGAVINARIPTVVFGAKDELTGSCGSVINLFEERYGHRVAVYGGILGDDCADLIRNFFKILR